MNDERKHARAAIGIRGPSTSSGQAARTEGRPREPVPPLIGITTAPRRVAHGTLKVSLDWSARGLRVILYTISGPVVKPKKGSGFGVRGSGFGVRGSGFGVRRRLGDRRQETRAGAKLLRRTSYFDSAEPVLLKCRVTRHRPKRLAPGIRPVARCPQLHNRKA
jgi:hypothetical protein